MSRTRQFASALCALALFAFVAPRFAEAGGASGSIFVTAKRAGSFETLTQLVSAAGLSKTLRFDGPYTVFAPTDEAFAKLPAGTVEALKKDPATLRNILLYHVVAGRVGSQEVVGLSSITMANGGTVAVSVDANGVKLNASTSVVTTDINASNGVIHVIDSVLLP